MSVLYWLSDDNVKLRFDVESEKIIEKPNPLKILPTDKKKYFGECSGRLVLIQTHTPPYSDSYTSYRGVQILEMDKDYCHWLALG